MRLKPANLPDYIIPIASKAFVYGMGFLATLLASSMAGASEFGKFALYQSLVELGALMGTLGAAFLTTRAVFAAGRVPFSDLRNSSLIGLLLCLVLISAYSWFAARIPLRILTLIIGSAVLMTFLQHALAILRGMNHLVIYNSDSGIRGTFFIGAIVFLHIAEFQIDATTLLSVTLAGCLLLLCFTLYTAVDGIEFSTQTNDGLRTIPRIKILLSGLISFANRKSDILILGAFSPLQYLAAYKVAFLLAEAPSQFSQAAINGETVQFARLGVSDQSIAILSKIIRNAIGLAAAISLLIYLGLLFSARFFALSQATLDIYNWLAVPLILRVYTIGADQFIQMTGSANLMFLKSALELAFRSICIGVLTVTVGLPLHKSYFILVILEILATEITMRIQGKHSLAAYVARSVIPISIKRGR